jgi:hypothetical protein
LPTLVVNACLRVAGHPAAKITVSEEAIDNAGPSGGPGGAA